MATTAAAILQAWKARINVLNAFDPANVDDRMRADVGMLSTDSGGRDINLTCQPGRRVKSGYTDSDWEAMLIFSAFYTGMDEQGYVHAATDTENVTADLYDWVSEAAGQDLGLLRFEPQFPTITADEENGECQVTMMVRVQYRGR